MTRLVSFAHNTFNSIVRLLSEWTFGLCVQPFFLCMASVLLFTLMGLHNAQAQVDVGSISSAFYGKSLVPTVNIGASGTSIQGSSAYTGMITEIYADGHVKFRQNDHIFNNYAVDYKVFNDGLSFTVVKVEAKKDCLEVKLSVDASSSTTTIIRFMMGTGWQSAMKTDAVIATAQKFLVTKEVYATLPKRMPSQYAASDTTAGSQTSNSNSGASNSDVSSNILDGSAAHRLAWDVDLRSLSTLNTIQWWKIASNIGKDTKSVWGDTKALQPKTTQYYWTYRFPIKASVPGTSNNLDVQLWLTDQRVNQVVVNPPVGFAAFTFYDNVPGPLDAWGKKVEDVSQKTAPVPGFYCGEIAMLVTQSEKTSTAATKMSFYYPAFYDKVAQYKFDGSVERNNVSFGNVILITYDLGNGYTFGATCTARPGNYMFSYSSTFDPGISQSPTTMSSRQFDWTRFAVSDFTYFPNDLIGSGRLPISNGGMSLNKETGKAFSSLNTDWVQFRLK